VLETGRVVVRRVVKPQPESETECPYHVGESRNKTARVNSIGNVGDKVIPLITIPNERDDYAVGMDGQVYSMTTGSWLPLKARPDPKGYLAVTLMGKQGRKLTRRVHRLVCIAWHGLPPTPNHQVRHLDGNPANSFPGNLTWGTQAENWQDRIAHGHGISGEAHPLSKFTDSEREHLRWAIRAKLCSQRHAARMLGVSQASIQYIVGGVPKPIPSISTSLLPEWASRLTLEIESVRVERGDKWEWVWELKKVES
jgi:hypothetical protein